MYDTYTYRDIDIGINYVFKYLNIFKAPEVRKVMPSTAALTPMTTVTTSSSMSEKNSLSRPMSENSAKNCSSRFCTYKCKYMTRFSRRVKRTTTDRCIFARRVYGRIHMCV